VTRTVPSHRRPMPGRQRRQLAEMDWVTADLSFYTYGGLPPSGGGSLVSRALILPIKDDRSRLIRVLARRSETVPARKDSAWAERYDPIFPGHWSVRSGR
jgi:hypothetical protein